MGWLRGERGHCGTVAVPTIDEEVAKPPHRERESLVGERTRIINRVKAALVRLGIRGFRRELCRAPKKPDELAASRLPAQVPQQPPANFVRVGHASERCTRPLDLGDDPELLFKTPAPT